jgi:transcriptional regulator with XRE-family HTH domain
MVNLKEENLQYIISTEDTSREDIIMTSNLRRGLATQSGMESIGERLMRLRQERGISQQDMAEQLGIAQPNISDYERGVLRLHGELIVKITKILGISSDELLGLTNNMPKRGPAPKLQHQLERLGQLPKAKQRVINEMLTGLLQQNS